MKKEIFINAALHEVKVAITEDSRLAEFYIELPDKERYIGNVYLGKVNRIIPSINAAFIDIGTKQDAFLHFSDVDETLEDTLDKGDDDDEPKVKLGKNARKEYLEKIKIDPKNALLRVNADVSFKGHNLAVFSTKKSGTVKINLTPGQFVLVQVTREAFQHKGVKVTTKIAIPGRYTVLMPFEKMLGISKKISNYNEKRRLRKLARQSLPEGFGCILRTAAKDKVEIDLLNDWGMILEEWETIQQKVSDANGPGLVYSDFNLAASVVRDLFTTQVVRIVIDSKKLYKELITYIRRVSPHLENKIELYTGKIPIYDEYKIQRDLNSTTRRKVMLPSGADIVIEQTEAMIVVDVNSGKATAKDQEANSFNVNLEAAREVARQMRLRDIGGMIVVDFIDMKRDQNKKKLLYEMRKELEKDRAKTVSHPLSQLGLLQITRQRINQNIQEKITDTCPVCKGTGRITSKTVLVSDIERWIMSFRKSSKEFRISLLVHPTLAEFLTKGSISIISKMMLKYFIKINVQQDSTVKIDEFKIFSVRQQRDITNDY